MSMETPVRVAVVIPAAGQGTRFGSQGPKALVLLDGEPLVLHAVRSMWASGVVDSVVVVAPEDHEGFLAVSQALSGEAGVQVVRGGASRQASVAAGLQAVGEADYVLIHDAARPLVPTEVVKRVVAALEAGYKAVVPALPVVDTIKSVGAPLLEVPSAHDVETCDFDVEVVDKTLDRSILRAMQTPQGFDFGMIYAAHTAAAERGKKEESSAPDDAALAEQAGVEVVLVEGSQRSLKITHPLDLAIAELFLRSIG